MGVASKLLGYPLRRHLQPALLREFAKRIPVLGSRALYGLNRRLKLGVIGRDTQPTARLYNGMESISNLDSQMVRDRLRHSEAHGIANLANCQRGHFSVSLRALRVV